MEPEPDLPVVEEDGVGPEQEEEEDDHALLQRYERQKTGKT